MNLRSFLSFGERRGDAARSDPFSTLQREIDRLFEEFSRFGSRDFFPSADVVERDDHIEITVELPGLEEKDVEVTLTDNILTIRGEKKNEREEKEGERRVVERSYGAFTRSIELPSGINPDNIQASMAKGVLTLTLPKPSESRPEGRKIEIKPTV